MPEEVAVSRAWGCAQKGQDSKVGHTLSIEE